MEFLKNPFFRFLIVGTGLYVLWYSLYEFVLKPHTGFDRFVITQILIGSKTLLTWLGFSVCNCGDSPEHWNLLRLLTERDLTEAQGVIVGAPCDGIELFALFVVFVLAFPGPWKHRIWYLPLGVLLIHGINILRVSSLAIIDSINPAWLAFNHDYTFTILVYLFVFLLWYVWVNRFSPLKALKQAKPDSHA
jgi:exosortase family protein XrtF